MGWDFVGRGSSFKVYLVGGGYSVTVSRDENGCRLRKQNSTLYLRDERPGTIQCREGKQFTRAVHPDRYKGGTHLPILMRRKVGFYFKWIRIFNK